MKDGVEKSTNGDTTGKMEQWMINYGHTELSRFS